MSKELAFTDDNDVVKYLDTTTAFNLALTADGVAFDLTNAKSILVKIANDDGYIMQEAIDLTTVTSPLGGTLSFPINQDIMNTLVPDDYDIEVWVTMNDGTQAIFPSDGTLGFSIEENLMSDTGEVIPIITLNDFQQQFNDLSSQMANAVQNVQKGDQGNPGNGIKSANNQYQLSDSPVTVPTGGWSDTILATTDQLPYLWTKIIFTYDDGTTNEINFVSSRGDTGSQGPIGPVGPQGKQGNGLVVRGKADKEENLPTTGNNQGDGYLVGTDLYIWIDGSWQNMGSITPDLADYVKVADMNNALNTKVNVTDMRKPASDVAGIEEVNQQLDKKVVDNKDGTEQLNGVRVQPFNKLSDTIGGRNLLLGTSETFTMTGNNTVNQFNQMYALSRRLETGTTLTISFDAVSTDLTNFTMITNGKDGGIWMPYIMSTADTTARHYVGTITLDGFSDLGVNVRLDNVPSTSTITVSNMKLEQGSIATDWTPAPEDKQDLIGYTPADDSKVAHLSGANNFDTVPTVNKNPLLLASSLPSDLARTGQDTNFTGKLQKSGIDVATTTDVKNAVNTATANMVDSSKLTNFTAGLQSGGIDVATAADLKSVEASAWRQLDITETNNKSSGESLLLCKIDVSTNACLIAGYINVTQSTRVVEITAAIPSDYKFSSIGDLPTDLNGGLSIAVNSSGQLGINYNPIRGGVNSLYWPIAGSDATALQATVTPIS